MLASTKGQEIVARASRLPLLDAAYYLLRRLPEIDRAEVASESSVGSSSSLPAPVQPVSQAMMGRLVRQAFASIGRERSGALESHMFAYLSSVHPHASEADLQAAIRTAAKFESDCLKCFSETTENPRRSRHSRAIGEAKRHNPGFQESTYEEAIKHLVRDLM